MNKRKLIESDNLIEETKITSEDGNHQDTISKKLITSSKATIVTTKNQMKEPVKMTLQEIKDLRSLKKKQENILMNIENDNIQKHVQQLIDKFDPPNCSNCTKRRADKVCINKSCGKDKYLQLICGKCHFEEHLKSMNKPEIDIEEYFLKLATFMNEQKYEKKDNQQRIDLDHLETIFSDIDSFRFKLDSLRSKLESEIEGYLTPQEMHGILQNSTMKALSSCDHESIHEQLVNIKKCVIFNKNKFWWNDASEKFKSYQNILKDLDKNTKETNIKISKSFIGGMRIDLGDIKFHQSNGICLSTNSKITKKDETIQITSNYSEDCQHFMDYKLSADKKYKIRFRFESQPTEYIMVGVMPLSRAHNEYVYNIPYEYFCKRFYCGSPTEECSRILKGQDLSNLAQKGWQIEMRIDIENNYVDFYDYPEINHINANHENSKFQKQDYVFAISMYNNQNVVIELFEEISSLEKLT